MSKTNQKLKKGFVKKILRNPLRVVVLGPKNKTTGFFMEKQLKLHCLEPVEEFEPKAFQELRRMLVGKTVLFDDYKGRPYPSADFFLEKQLVQFVLA